MCNLLCKSEPLVEVRGVECKRLETEKKVQFTLVMEKMEMDLKALIFRKSAKEKESIPLSLKDKYEIILKVARGVNELHEMNFVHCDLKL